MGSTLVLVWNIKSRLFYEKHFALISIQTKREERFQSILLLENANLTFGKKIRPRAIKFLISVTAHKCFVKQIDLKKLPPVDSNFFKFSFSDFAVKAR